MGRPGWYHDGHPPACTCVACNEGSRRGRSTATAVYGGGTGGRSTATAYYDDGGGGDGNGWKWILLAIVVTVVAVVALGIDTEDIRRFLASSQPTPAPVVIVITATPANTPTSTSTPAPTLTPTSTHTPKLALAATSAATHTPTPVPTATLRPTFTPTVTNTPTSTATGTSTSTPTITPTVTPTAFVCGHVEMVLIGAGKAHRHCHTATPEGYVAPLHTNTPAPTSTATPIPLYDHTPVPTITPTAQPFRVVVISVHTNTPTVARMPVPTNTPRIVVVPRYTSTPAPVATHTPTQIFVNSPIPTIGPLPTFAPLSTIAPISTAAPTRTPLQITMTTTDKPNINIRQLEDRTHELINAERVKRGLSSLEHIRKIGLIARSHSEDMAKRGYFAHESPEGLSPTDRGTQAGYNCRKDYGTYYTYGLAENIHQGWLYDSFSTRNGRVVSYVWFTLEGLARTAVSGWMNSKGHRENILKPSYDKSGIGVAIAQDGKVYFTQNFC